MICQLETDEGPTTLCTYLCKADILIFLHNNDNCTQVTVTP